MRGTVTAVDAAEVAFEEVTAERGSVDFVFAVEAPGERRGVGGVGDGEAMVGMGEGFEALVLEEGAEEAVEVVQSGEEEEDGACCRLVRRELDGPGNLWKSEGLGIAGCSGTGI